MATAVQITRQRKADLLCCAFEGGSNYWYQIEKFVKPTRFEFYSNPELGKGTKENPAIFAHLDYPLNPGGALIIKDLEDTEIDGKTSWTLNQKAINKGLEIMARDYPQHFADVISENDDSTTGDVFLQCCLFGELIFG